MELCLVLWTKFLLAGRSVKSSLKCEQYASDNDVFQSLPFNYTTIKESESSCSSGTNACIKVNSQQEAVSLILFTRDPDALQYYCLSHLRELTVTQGGSDGASIPPEIGSIANLTRLVHYSVAGTNGLPETIGKLKNLKSLTLNGKLEELPCTLSALESLLDLTVSTPLKTIPSFLSILPLRSLNFNGAKFFAIPDDFFRNLNPTLRFLFLMVENLTSFDSFSELSQLENLVLHVKNLAEFPLAFTFLTAVRRLDIVGHNRISSLPQNFSRTLASLDMLNLQHNYFTEIPIQALLSKKLKSLYLDYNRVVDISNVALVKGPLQYLLLKGNQIETLPEDINYLSDTLETLDLSENKLTTVPAEVLVKMRRLRFLGLEKNLIAPDEIERLKVIFAVNQNIRVAW